MFLYYTVLTVLAIFSQIVMLAILKSDNMLPKENKRYFSLAFITFVIGTFIEWLSEYCLLYHTHVTFYYTLLQAIMYSVVPLIAYYLGSAFEKFKNKKRLKFLIVLNVFFQLLSFTSFFENSSHHVFKLGNTYLIYFVISKYILYRMFVQIYKVSKSYQSGNITILIINIVSITLFATVVQSLWNELNTIAISDTVNAIILYSYFGSLINKRDGLTLLLNRRCFENRIKSLKHNSIFLFIDLNKFKKINDTHGHLVGDKILSEIATICLETFSNHGSSYRIGGDEYCVVIKKHLEDVETLINTLHRNIDIKRKEDPLLPSVSVGYGYFTHNKNTVNDAINEADEMMYELKHKHKISELKIDEGGA